ncbi:hypothetical protein HWV62_35482 [Athelia sp. TMB]|nr:hypothetical protein HWV62_35482 [Athelia sp. TMB]
MVYTYLVTNFGNWLYLGDIVWSILLEVLFNGFTALLVQTFMTIRVFRLTPPKWRWPAAGLVACLVVGEFICVVIYYARGVHIKTYAELVKLKANSEAINALGAAGDVVIAVIISDTMINTLILFTMNTGLLTSLCAVASLVSIIAAPNTFIYIAFFFNIGRLYSNSLLATLNSRSAIRGMLSETQTVSMSKLRNHGTNASNTLQQRTNTRVDIKMETTQHYISDEASENAAFEAKVNQLADEEV